MVVAFYIPHNEGIAAGVITGPDFDTGLNLVDLFEVDGTVKSFETEEEADDWLGEKFTDSGSIYDPQPVAGGVLSVTKEDW